MTIETQQLIFRPARAEDRDAIFAMVATVWDGTDYIPEVWDEWLHASNGPLIVGELDARPVTLYKLTGLSEQEDWLEGVRVDPDYRGRGLARELVRNAIEVARQRGKRTLRYDTSEYNQTMQRLANELGFQLAMPIAWYSAKAIDNVPTYQPLPITSLPQLRADAEHSALLRQNRGLYTYGWTAYTFTEERLAKHLADGQIVGLPDRRAWALIVPRERDGYWLALAHGQDDDLVALLHALRCTTEPHDGGAFVRMHIQAGAELIPLLEQAGYTLGEHAARVYEYVLQ